MYFGGGNRPPPPFKIFIKNMNDILKNPKGKLIAVDLDGTLSEGECWNETDEPKPIKKIIDFVNSLYSKGAHIIIYTARFPNMYQMTLAWLLKYGVLFHGISMRVKTGADLYIDDKCINILDINKIINKK